VVEDGVDKVDIRAWETVHGEEREAVKLAKKIEVFRSEDFAKIRELCSHARIFPHISDDFTDKKNFPLPSGDAIRYLLCRDDEGVFGFVIFMATNYACWEAHVGFLPRSYGSQALRAFKAAISWMWANTRARRVTGAVIRENALALRFARKAGFEIFGVNKKAYLKGGKLHDQICLGISKP
jgi:RimJ/RimL family protein N-acetyltransferase